MKNLKINFVNLYLLVLLLLCAGSLRAQTNYSQTAQQLEEKMQNEQLSGLEYYNLGTAYAKLDSLAAARLYLEKAQLLLPWNTQIEKNIRWVRTELATDIAIIPDFFFTKIWRKMSLSLAPIIWQLLGILLLLLILAAVFYIIYWKPEKNSNWTRMGIAGIGLLAICCFGFSSSSRGHLYDQKRCVVIESQGDLKEAPEKSSISLTELIGGTAVEVLEELGDWNKVRLEDGSIGWLERKYLKNIAFNPTKTS